MKTVLGSQAWRLRALLAAVVALSVILSFGLASGPALALPLFQSPPPTPPANDNFADATAIGTLPFTDRPDTTYATAEGEEPQNCYYSNYTVWYSFTPDHNMLIHLDMAGGQYEANVSVYRAYGSGIADLSFIGCGAWGNSVEFQAQAGITYYFQAGSIFGPGTLQINVQEIPPPANDNFINATAISSLPFNDSTADTRGATTEPGELPPSCSGSIYRTVWYAFTASESGSFTISTDASFTRVMAVYTGGDLASLAEVACRAPWSGPKLTFHGDAGMTYHIQVGGYDDEGGGLSLGLGVTPLPQAGFWFSPMSPTTFDSIAFNNSSWDPGEAGILAAAWDFGDGTTSTDWSPNHRYAQDGDYLAKLTVTTPDGRSASAEQTVSVRTHDIAVVRLVVPNTAKAGQTRPISVQIKNTRYPERVRILLYKSVPGNYQLVGETVQNIPVRSGGRTTSVSFTYTFTADDAVMGKVTFRVAAGILDWPDALPADNEAISPPTKVTR